MVVDPWLELESDGELEETSISGVTFDTDAVEVEVEIEKGSDAELVDLEEPLEDVTMEPVDPAALEVAVEDAKLEVNCEEHLEDVTMEPVEPAAEVAVEDAKLKVNCEDAPVGEVGPEGAAEAEGASLAATKESEDSEDNDHAVDSAVDDVNCEDPQEIAALLLSMAEDLHGEDTGDRAVEVGPVEGASLEEPLGMVADSIEAEAVPAAPTTTETDVHTARECEEQTEAVPSAPTTTETDVHTAREREEQTEDTTEHRVEVCKVEAVSPMKPTARAKPEDTVRESGAGPSGRCKVQCEADYEEDAELSDGEIVEDAKTEETEASEGEDEAGSSEVETAESNEEPKEAANAGAAEPSCSSSRVASRSRSRRRTHRRRRHSRGHRSRRRRTRTRRSGRRGGHSEAPKRRRKRRRNGNGRSPGKDAERCQKKQKLDEAEVVDEKPRDDDKAASAETAPPFRAASAGKPLAMDGTRSQREVYVGGLFWKEADKESIAEAFNTAFESLPDYQQRYGEHPIKRPVHKVHFPREKVQQSEHCERNGLNDFQIYVFVEFSDQLLARSALKLTGLRIKQRSVRVKSTAGLDLQGDTLDVEPLREKELLPFKPLDGSSMLLQVWLGGIPMRACRQELRRQAEDDAADPGSLESQINAAVLKLPGVQLRYPELQRGIVNLRISDCQRYVFVETATELIAASIVAARQLTLQASGFETITGWPVSVLDAKARAPPPLAADGHIADPSQVPLLAQKAVVDEEDFAERLECEIFLGGTHGLEVGVLWQSLTELLMALPSYREHYPELSLPIINIRMASGPYAFSRLATARLASTAVVMGEMWVGKNRVALRRPTHSGGETVLAAPLDVLRPLPPPPAPLEPPPPAEQQEEPADTEREPPPPPPQVPAILPWRKKVHNVWVGNLPGREKMLEGMEAEDDEKLEDKETAMELMKRRLDQRLTELAVQMPGYDLEDGPITRRLTVHSSGKFAFVRLLGDEEFVEEFLDVVENQDFLGKPLRVNWARRKDHTFWRNKKPRFGAPAERKSHERKPNAVQLPRGLMDLVAETNSAKSSPASPARSGSDHPMVEEPKKIEVDEL